jgi:hypothetical protein
MDFWGEMDMGWVVMAMAVLMVLGALLWFKPSSSKSIGETQGKTRRNRRGAEEVDAEEARQEAGSESV